jgi:hypothetical protein
MRYAGHYHGRGRKARIIYNPRIKRKSDRDLVVHHEKVERRRRVAGGESFPKAHREATHSERRMASKRGCRGKCWRRYGGRMSGVYQRSKSE